MRADTFIRWTVMLAALVSTGYAEHHLGTWIGWNQYVAFVIPVVADLYLIYATRTGRDVAPAVSVVIALSAASYLCTSPLDPVKTSISVAVSSLAPLVLWRLHANHATTEHVSPVAEVEEKVLTPLAEKRKELIWGETAELPDIPFLTTAEVGKVDEKFEEAEAPDPDPAPVRLSDAEAKRMAEYAFVNGVKAADAVESVTRSKATCYRWFREFEAAGVKRLVTA